MPRDGSALREVAVDLQSLLGGGASRPAPRLEEFRFEARFPAAVAVVEHGPLFFASGTVADPCEALSGRDSLNLRGSVVRQSTTPTRKEELHRALERVAGEEALEGREREVVEELLRSALKELALPERNGSVFVDWQEESVPFATETAEPMAEEGHAVPAETAEVRWPRVSSPATLPVPRGLSASKPLPSESDISISACKPEPSVRRLRHTLNGELVECETTLPGATLVYKC